MAIKKKQKSQAQKVVKKAPVVKNATAKKIDSTEELSLSGKMKGEYLPAVGRRKTATARVRLFKQAGDYLVNGLVVGKYFSTIPGAAAIYNQPFIVTNTLGQFGVTVKVSGSGINGQLVAVRHALSRALVKFNPEWRPLLKEARLLTRDDRMKESRKMGMGGKARRKRQSPKR
ncbi:30S ribosomal protein S9 [Microgenomates group bacterium]|nr:30S ribosomal protein S9 [Microgenomates group bacterium]